MRSGEGVCPIRRRTHLAPALLAAALLAACGGGGSASAPPTPTGPSMSVSPSPVSETAGVSAAAPTADVSVTFTDAPATAYFMASDFTTNGISSVSTPVYTGTSASFVVSFKAPSGLKPATYTDTDTLLLCSDPQCQTVLAKFPLTVNYTVTVATTAPQVTLDSTSLNIQALSIDAGDVSATPDPSQFTFTNFTAPPYVQLSAPTTGGISNLNFVMSDPTHGGIALVMQSPSNLAPGTYNTTIQATVCLDSSCVNQVGSGNLAIALTYVIGNSVTMAGTSGYTLTFFPAAAQAITGNAAQSTVYASISSTATSHASTIVALNPMNGTAIYSAPLYGGSVALSDDGQYLYAANATGVERLLASDLSANLTIPGAGGVSIAVAPGQPQTIAAAGRLGSSLQIFDGAVARPNAFAICGFACFIDGLQWGTTASVVYAQNGLGAGAPEPECAFGIDANGYTGAVSCSSTNTAPFSFANGLGYEPGGAIVNATSWATVANLSVPNGTLATPLPDTALGKVFAFVSGASSGCTIQSFDLTSRAAIANMRLPTLDNTVQTCGYPDDPIPVRWGANGIALSTSSYIIAISGKFVGP